MTNNSTDSQMECDSIIDINDYPTVIKEFFVNVLINIEKNKWTAKCKFCSLSIRDGRVQTFSSTSTSTSIKPRVRVRVRVLSLEYEYEYEY